MNGNSEGEWIGGQKAELVAHYKGRLRAMLPYVRHKAECQLGRLNMPATCTCGASALFAIIHAEVYDEKGNPV